MEGGRPRKRFVPMSGELEAMVNYQPPDPAEDAKHQVRRKKRPPATRRAIVLGGLLRLSVTLVVVLGGVAVIAGLVVWLGDGSAHRVFPLAYYFAAAAVGGAALVTGGGGAFVPYFGGPSEREGAVSASAIFGCVAVLLFAFGALLDYLL